MTNSTAASVARAWRPLGFLMCGALASVVLWSGAGQSYGAANSCKPPKKLYKGKCRYADEIRQLKRNAARKKKKKKKAQKVTKSTTDRAAAAGQGASKAGNTRPKPAIKDGTLGGRCYGNNTCNSGLTCVKGRCRAPKAKAKPTSSGALLSPAGLTWIRLAGGQFTMGYSYGDGDEKPPHTVRLSAILMSKSEITVGQYRACVKARRCDPRMLDSVVNLNGRRAAGDGMSANPAAGCNWGRPSRDAHPVNCVSWQQASDFCSWVGGRLPTEAEWEYAARAGQERMYPWGDTPPTCQHAVIDNGVYGCGLNSTHPVCSKRLGHTAKGLCDMAGNVWEWVADWYGAYGSNAEVNPRGPLFGSKRVRRGGSWVDKAKFVRVANRFSLEPGFRNAALGFRCAAKPR